jgi:hypothetical protein
MAERGLGCATCGRQTLHRQREPNHVLWAILTLFSCGFFGIVWIIDSIKSGNAPWVCGTCGTPYAPPPGAPSLAGPGVAKSFGQFALAVGGFVVVGLVGVLGLAWYSSHKLAAEREAEAKRWREMPYTTSTPPPSSGNPTHDKLMALSVGEREAALAVYVRDRGHKCATTMRAYARDPLGADATATWDVACPDGGEYAVEIAADPAGSAKVTRAARKKK